MYSTYEFWRKKRDEKNMLTALRHQVAQDTNLHFYIFFKFETLQKFSDMTRQYGGTRILQTHRSGFYFESPLSGWWNLTALILKVILQAHSFTPSLPLLEAG